METFSSEDMFQKYLLSQSELSKIVQKPKKLTLNTKQININCKEPIIKSKESSNKESGSEYFPSSDSGIFKLVKSKVNLLSKFILIFRR